jgi:uncharacterized membrane protein
MVSDSDRHPDAYLGRTVPSLLQTLRLCSQILITSAGNKRYTSANREEYTYDCCGEGRNGSSCKNDAHVVKTPEAWRMISATL